MNVGITTPWVVIFTLALRKMNLAISGTHEYAVCTAFCDVRRRKSGHFPLKLSVSA